MEANDYQTQAMRTDDGKMGARIRHKLDVEFFNGATLKGSVDGVDDVGGLIYAALSLGGESGEVVDIIKKWAGQEAQLDKAHLTEELGDVLWSVAKICDSIGVYMSDVMGQNIDKLWKRYPDGFDVERANNRGTTL